MALEGLLLPSEIARLVYGYLRDENCDSAATSLLKDSLHLQECYSFFLRGGKFNTRVCGLSLVNVLDKYCELSEFVQEKWSTLPEFEQSRISSKDLLEQVKYLLECPKRRFVVNVNVPTQTSSPEALAKQSRNSRKRNRSTSVDKDYFSKRVARMSTEGEQQSDHVSAGNCAVEATPLENLPGHIAQPQNECVNKTQSTVKMDGSTNVHDKEHERLTQSNVLMTDAFAQVENPFLFPLRPKGTNEPVENLSLLSKELLNCTELHERIAENINKSMPFRDAIFGENISDTAPSLMTEWQKAIDAIIDATENDPKFLELFDEIIGQGNIISSSEEDSKAKGDSGFTDEEEENHMDTDDSRHTSTVFSVDPSSEKNESSDQQGFQDLPNTVNDKNPVQESQDWEKAKILEDQNAAAVMSIIKATNAMTENEIKENDVKTFVEPPIPIQNKTKAISKESKNKDDTTKYSYNNAITSTPLKVNEDPSKLDSPSNWFSEKEMMAMPVIICSNPDASTKGNNTPLLNKELKLDSTPLMPYFSPLSAMECQLKTPDSFNFQGFIQPSMSFYNSSKIETPTCIIQSKPIVEQSIAESIPQTIADCNKVGNTPAVEMSDSMSLISNELSPFLKICKKLKEPVEAAIVQKEEKDDSKIWTNSDVIEKLTPQTLLQNRSQNHRLSLSTPRKPKSHIRALDFNTPMNKSFSEKKMMNSSVHNVKRSASTCKSLFNSPTLSQPNKQFKFEKTVENSAKKVVTAKKSWDEDLRKNLNYLMDKPPVKAKPKPRSKRKSMPKNGAKKEEPENVTEKKEEVAKCNEEVNKLEKIEEKIIVEDKSLKVEVKVKKKEIKIETKEITAKKETEEKKETDYKKIEEELERITTTNCPIVTNDTIVTTVETERKFAEVKNETSKPSESSGKIKVSAKNVFRIEHSRLPSMIDLETPSKDKSTLSIPATPRFLSPGSGVSMPAIRPNDSKRPIVNVIATPEFPMTPCINLTPRALAECNITADKTEGSPYYEPSIPEETKKTEITQFEVIKENLPKINSAQNLSIVSKTSDSSGTSSDSSSSCSSSCSSYTTSSSDEENSSEDECDETVENESKIEETSPKKVFAIEKSDEAIKATVKETPAKDENSCVEVDIFETPSSSKAGIENSTNLTSKITELEATRASNKFVEPARPKIISIKQHLPPVIIKPPPKSQSCDKPVEQKTKDVVEEKEGRSEVKTEENNTVEKTVVKKTENETEVQAKDTENKRSRMSTRSSTRGSAENQVDLNDSLNLNIAQCQPIINVVYVETDEKKKRRKKFTDSDLVCSFDFSDETGEREIRPTKYEVLFSMNPSRRKPTVVSKKKNVSVITTRRIRSNFSFCTEDESESTFDKTMDDKSNGLNKPNIKKRIPTAIRKPGRWKKKHPKCMYVL